MHIDFLPTTTQSGMTTLMMDPLGQQSQHQQQQQQQSSGSFFLVNHPASINGIDANATGNHEQRGSGGIGVGNESKSTDNLVGKSSSSSKKRSSKKRGSKNSSGGLDFSNEMPTAVQGGSDLDRISQLMARCTATGGAMNLFGGNFNKGDGDLLADLMIENSAQRKGYRYDGSPLMMGTDNSNSSSWSRSGGGGGGALPHPMMMMPGQQNLMSNYFTPSLMMKTPNNAYLNSDYSSLPPAVNLNQLLLEQEEIDGVQAQRSLSDKHRFSSDPGGSDNEIASSNGERTAAGGGGVDVGLTSRGSNKRQSNDSTSTSSGTGVSGSGSSSESQQNRQRTRSSRSGTNGGGGGASMSHMNDPRILGTLLEQINLLHETNSKICRNLHDTKVEIEALKHAPSWGLRHRRDSISGLSTHSQPLGYGFGTQSPAPASFHSGAYTPGMMTDVVREVREGARVREDAMLNRVKTLVDERSWQANELNYKLQRDVEDLKGQVQELKKEKLETNHRLSELELEIKTMRIVFGAQLQALGGVGAMNGNGTSSSVGQLSMAQQVAVSLRNASQSPLPQRQMVNESTPLSTRRNQLNIKYGVLNEQESPLEVLSSTGAEMEAQEKELMEKLLQKYKTTSINNNNSNNNGETAAMKVRDSEHVVMQMEKDTFDLRRELQDAVAGKKSAEQRVLTLEKEMQNMQDSLRERRTDPVKLNNFSKSEVTLNKFANGGDFKVQRQQQQQHANTVQTVVVGSTTRVAVGQENNGEQLPPKGNGFCLTGPVTDL